MSPASPSSKRLPPKPKAEKVARPIVPVPAASASPEPVEMARELAAIVESHSLSELIVETAGLTLTIRRGVASGGAAVHAPSHPAGHALGPAPVSHQIAPAPAAPIAAPVVEDNRHVVASPFVGTFYRSPSPDAQAYVSEGQRVEKGQVLCIVEAMKLMNEIEADIAGIITDALVENGKTVEYGQPLFKISPA